MTDKPSDDDPVEPDQTERMVPGVLYCKLVFDLQTNRIRIISYDHRGQRVGTRSFNDDPQVTIEKQMQHGWEIVGQKIDEDNHIVYMKLNPK